MSELNGHDGDKVETLGEGPKLRFSIGMVAERTGLSAHLIRVWERRYGVVSPDRSGTNRRLYGEEDIERLLWLRGAVGAGYPISRVAGLTTEALRELGTREKWRNGSEAGGSGGAKTTADFGGEASGLEKGNGELDRWVGQAMEAIIRMDSPGLMGVLQQASSALGWAGMMTKFVVPLVHGVGEGWRLGELKVAHEHLATATIRTFLGNFSRCYSLPETSPGLVSTTPPGQLHELGALLVSAMACHSGWRVAFMGPSLPVEEIVGVAETHRARVVALSVVYPEDDPMMEGELLNLRSMLPAHVEILVGGRAVFAYERVLKQIGAVILRDLRELPTMLEEIRRRPAPTCLGSDTRS